MISCKAFYFDGQTSRPLEVHLSYVGEENLLIFKDPVGEDLHWNLYDCEVNFDGNSCSVTHKSHSDAYLKIHDFDFVRQLSQTYQTKRENFYRRFLKLGLGVHLLFFSGLVALILCAYFIFLPFFSDKIANFIPQSLDEQIGTSFMDDFLNHETIDMDKTQLLNEFKDKLQLNNTKRIHIYVVKSSEINAFALPNGEIVVFTGILEQIKSSDELAALLGHEVTHVNKRHSIRALCKNLFGYLMISAFFSDINGVYSIIMENVHTLQTLSYSREFEKEADEGSIEILRKNRISMNGVIRLLNNIDEKKNLLPNFLSTHPISSERIKFVKNKIRETPRFLINTNKEQELNSVWKKIKG